MEKKQLISIKSIFKKPSKPSKPSKSSCQLFSYHSSTHPAKYLSKFSLDKYDTKEEYVSFLKEMPNFAQFKNTFSSLINSNLPDIPQNATSIWKLIITADESSELSSLKEHYKKQFSEKFNRKKADYMSQNQIKKPIFESILKMIRETSRVEQEKEISLWRKQTKLMSDLKLNEIQLGQTLSLAKEQLDLEFNLNSLDQTYFALMLRIAGFFCRWGPAILCLSPTTTTIHIIFASIKTRLEKKIIYLNISPEEIFSTIKFINKNIITAQEELMRVLSEKVGSIYTQQYINTTMGTKRVSNADDVTDYWCILYALERPIKGFSETQHKQWLCYKKEIELAISVYIWLGIDATSINTFSFMKKKSLLINISLGNLIARNEISGNTFSQFINASNKFVLDVWKDLIIILLNKVHST